MIDRCDVKAYKQNIGQFASTREAGHFDGGQTSSGLSAHDSGSQPHSTSERTHCYHSPS